MDQTITCECGAVYGPTDNYGIKRHEASKSHQKAMQQASEERSFAEADRDAADEDGWDLDEPIETPAYPATFEELDESSAAKALTADERRALVSDIALTKGALDGEIGPSTFAYDYVTSLVEATPTINVEIVDDLLAYVEGAVVLLRKDAEGNEAPIEPTEAEILKAQAPRSAGGKGARSRLEAEVVVKRDKAAKPKVATKASDISGVVNRKACRVCKIDKPLEDYRKKSSRPDGRDTICADCSKQWLINHKAKAGAK